MKLSLPILSIILAAASAGASAETLVFDRGLPTANLNYAAGANRSNLTFGFTDSTLLLADDFSIKNSSSSQWEVTHIRLWTIIPNTYPNQDDDTPAEQFDDISLYLGSPLDTMSVIKTANFTTDGFTDDSDVTLTPTTYSDGSTYERGNGTGYDALYQVDFTGLHISASALQSFQFGVHATPKTYRSGSYLWFNHASNAALSGSQQDGSNGLTQVYQVDGSYIGSLDTTASYGKPTDLNVQVWAQAVPEPGEFGFLAIAGLGLLSAAKRKIKRS